MIVEEKYAQTIAVVYPAVAPSDAYNIPTDRSIRTHITISILGETSEIDFTQDQLLSSLRHVDWEVIDDMEVKGLELFGPDNDFLVMVIDSPALQRNWKRVTEALTNAGIQCVDRYPSYRPHITLMENYEGLLPTPDFLPPVLKVGFPELWWGTETIPLRSY